jgi:hypothetical protein
MRAALSGSRRVAIVAALVTLPNLAGLAEAQDESVPAFTKAQEVPTFAKDVAPIFQRSCQVCHRPNNMAPMSLMTYREARPWARSIKQKVAARSMPPWHIDKKVGIQSFRDDRSLSEQEIDTIVRWVDAGAPMGNAADLPKPVEFQDFGAWTIEPDWIVSSTPHTVRAGDLRVVHHVLTYAVTDPEAPAEDSSGDVFLNEYAVGKNADTYPDGTGKLLEADAGIRFSFHYHSVGEEVTDSTDLGLVFYPEGERPDYQLYSRQLANAGELDIPAGQVVRHDGYQTMHLPGIMTAFQPHMHMLGTRQCLELIYPTGQREMVNCANFDFNWHIVYNYEDQAQPIYPAGTTLHVISYHDNTNANRGNLDPKNWAGGGDRTIDEMAFAWISWYDLSEEEYAKQLAARKNQTDNSDQ